MITSGRVDQGEGIDQLLPPSWYSPRGGGGIFPSLVIVMVDGLASGQSAKDPVVK